MAICSLVSAPAWSCVAARGSVLLLTAGGILLALGLQRGELATGVAELALGLAHAGLELAGALLGLGERLLELGVAVLQLDDAGLGLLRPCAWRLLGQSVSSSALRCSSWPTLPWSSALRPSMSPCLPSNSPRRAVSSLRVPSSSDTLVVSSPRVPSSSETRAASVAFFGRSSSRSRAEVSGSALVATGAMPLPSRHAVEVAAQVVGLLGHPPHLGDDVVEEVIDLPLVVTTTELGLGERLVEDVLGRESHVQLLSKWPTGRHRWRVARRCGPAVVSGLVSVRDPEAAGQVLRQVSAHRPSPLPSGADIRCAHSAAQTAAGAAPRR